MKKCSEASRIVVSHSHEPNRQLLLITSHFPYGLHDEFLSQEIRFLAEEFEEVVIAPVRPDVKSHAWELPSNVLVDLSLANMISPRFKEYSPTALRVFRRIRYILIAMIRNYRILSEFMPDPSKLRKNSILSAMRAIADFQTVLKWANDRKPFQNVYTFWIGAETCALKQAWMTSNVITRAHGSDLYEYSNDSNFLPQVRLALSLADSIYTVSEHGKQYAIEFLQANESKIKVARLGIQIPKSLTKPSKDQKRRVLTVSSINKNKRIDLIFEIVARLSLHIDEKVVWTHFGSGDLDIKRKIESRATNFANLEIRFMGSASKEILTQYYETENIDLFINFSKSEGLPISILEALSYGIPVLAPNVGGISEIVKAPMNCLIETDSEIDDIVKLGIQLISLRTDLRNGRRESVLKYEANLVYSQWIAEIRSSIPNEKF